MENKQRYNLLKSELSTSPFKLLFKYNKQNEYVLNLMNLVSELKDRGNLR